jgi:hypothetical protein
LFIHHVRKDFSRKVTEMPSIVSHRPTTHCKGTPWLEGSVWTGRWLVLAGLLFFFLSCAPHGMFSGEVEDLFGRTYAVSFQTFHPKLNSALQQIAREQKGNSFQVLRLGSDGVVIRGLYQRHWDHARFGVSLRVVPLGPDQTRIEMQISSNRPDTSTENLAMAAGELFQIIEDRTAVLSMKP